MLRPRERTRKIRWLVAIAVVVICIFGAAAIAPIRHALLRGIGGALTFSDGVDTADLIAMDVESGAAGVLTLSDLYHAHPSARLALLRPLPTSLDAELAGRGVALPDFAFDTLVQLGVPAGAIVRIAAGEGGTTESTSALAAWARANPAKRVLVVVGPSHGRRYRRALRRAWPRGLPAPAVVTTRYSLFRSDDWWQSRTTLREGLVEIEKLALDYAAHPF